MTAAGIHERLNVLLPWYVNGTLEGTEEEEIREHLRDCSACAEELDVLLEVAGALNRDSSPGERPVEGVPHPAGRERMPAWRRSWMPMLPLAAALLAAGFLTGWLASQLPPRNEASGTVRGFVRLLDLGGGGSRDTAGGAPLLVSGETDALVVLLVRAPLTDALLALELRGPKGAILTQAPRDVRRDALGRIAIAVEAGLLREPGAYELLLREKATAEESRTFSYPFRVEPAP